MRRRLPRPAASALKLIPVAATIIGPTVLGAAPAWASGTSGTSGGSGTGTSTGGTSTGGTSPSGTSGTSGTSGGTGTSTGGTSETSTGTGGTRVAVAHPAAPSSTPHQPAPSPAHPATHPVPSTVRPAESVVRSTPATDSDDQAAPQSSGETAISGGSGAVPAVPATTPANGYWMLTANGGVFVHGQLGFYGAPKSTQGAGSTVALVPTTDNKGYWIVGSSGQVQTFGDAIDFGTATPAELSAPVRALVPTSDGMGYWLVTSNGGVFSFGDAAFHGSAWTGGPLDIVAAAATPDGGGYWLAASNGRVYNFGDAGSFGSGSPQMIGSSSVVGLATTPDGLGYWLATANGGVFSFGDARFYGSQPAAGTSDPVVSITPTADGRGYWLATAAGKVTAYGDATLFPNPNPDPYTAPVVGLAVARSGALVDVPVAYVAADHQAAATCPGLSWTLLAAIGKVESDFGRTTLPGVTSGANYAGAAGPMQMGIGGAAGPTFFAYDHPVPADEAPNPPGAAPAGGDAGSANPPSPYDLTDAVFAAARDLCSNGAGNPATVRDAVLAYNHSDNYADEVLALAATYGGSTPQAPEAVRLAMTQIGVRYVWGGATPNVGFDCSGLVQWAYGAAGVNLPRTSEEHWLAVVHLPAGTPLQPGDPLFFGPADGPTHVGIYIGNGLMVDAPHTGASVRVESYDWSDYLGAG